MATRLFVVVVFVISFLFGVFEDSPAQITEKGVLKEAIALFDQGKYEECIRKLHLLPHGNPATSAEVFHVLGLSHYSLEQYDRAVSALSKSIRKDPDLIANYYYRGQSYLYLDRYEEAARDYDSYLHRENHEKVGSVNTAVLNYSYCLVTIGETEEAIEFLERYPAKAAKHFNALAWYTYEHRGEDERAIHYYEEALKLDPKLQNARENLSIWYSEAGDYNMAFFHVEKLIEYYPDYGRGYYLKAVYLEEMGEELDAIIYYTRARQRGYDGEEEGE